MYETKEERAASVPSFMESLKERGFHFEGRLWVRCEDSKGLRAGRTAAWGDKIALQRGPWHKRRNGVEKVRKQNKAEAAPVQSARPAAYERAGYAEAKAALQEVGAPRAERGFTVAAARRKEGREETLTRHRLRVPLSIREGFKTSNLAENVNRSLRDASRPVCRWTPSLQRHHWAAALRWIMEDNLKPIPKGPDRAHFVRVLSLESTQPATGPYN